MLKMRKATRAEPVQNIDWAIITPSYRGDYERCQLLCESMDALVTGPWHHYIIVDRIDFELFRPMQSEKRTILIVENILPPWLRQIKFLRLFIRRSVYFSFPFGFAGGWQIQQVVKLSMAFHLKEEGLLYCDSDVFFLRRFNVSTLNANGSFRFFRTKETIQYHSGVLATFLAASSLQLGLGKYSFPGPRYVDNLVPWHAPTVRLLCERVSEVSGKDWRVALGARFMLSEYTLYGLFVEHTLKSRSYFFETNESLCLTAWDKSHLEGADFGEYVKKLAPHQVAIGIQSFINMRIDVLRSHLHSAIKNHG
jgi:hypothetical protein